MFVGNSLVLQLFYRSNLKLLKYWLTIIYIKSSSGPVQGIARLWAKLLSKKGKRDHSSRALTYCAYFINPFRRH